LAKEKINSACKILMKHYNEKWRETHTCIFHAYLIVRYDNNGKKYLYDIINIKKEASNPLCHQET